MEENSRLENLVEFKVSYRETVETIKKCIIKFFPEKNKSEVENFIYTFFPLMYGIYPYVKLTAKQKTAMKRANIEFKNNTIYDIAYNGIIKLLN